MPVSRKHYQAIASIFKAHAVRALNDAGDNGGADVWLSLRDDMAGYLATTNDNFDYDRFRRATEPDGKGEPDAPGAKHFIVRNNSDASLAWSNARGWVDGDDYDVFTAREASALNLPMGGRWVPLS